MGKGERCVDGFVKNEGREEEGRKEVRRGKGMDEVRREGQKDEGGEGMGGKVGRMGVRGEEREDGREKGV